MDGKPLGKKERQRLEKDARRAADRARLGKAAVNVMLVCLLTLFVIDALPAGTSLHAWLQRAIDPILDVTGLWQGRWNLFAPEPDKVNSSISAAFTYQDGSVARWRTPDWRGLGTLRRKRLFRQMEYFDGIRLGDNKLAWPAFAQWLALTEGRSPTGELPVRVELTRHTTVIPPPPPGLGLFDRVELGELPEQREVFFSCWRTP